MKSISPLDEMDDRDNYKKYENFLKSLPERFNLQPKQEWSEEDEAHRAFILESLENQIRFCKKDAEGAYYAKQIRTAQNWLKFLRLKSHWKPTEEQLEALWNTLHPDDPYYVDLSSLYNDLKNNYNEN